MKKFLKTLFFVVSVVFCCLIFNCESVFAATTTTCSKSGNYCSTCGQIGCNHDAGKYCNICHQKSCTHVVGRSYINVVYYYYVPGQVSYGDDITYLKKSGEVKEENIVLIRVDSANTFKTNWNSMGTHNGQECCIRAVIVNMHGKKGENVIGDINGLNNNGGIRITQGDINSLSNKPVQRVVLLTCYGAYGNTNVASLFSKKIMKGEVIAGNEKVYPHQLNTWYNSEIHYYIYYVDNEPITEYGYNPLQTTDDEYDWIIYRNGNAIKTCSGDCYSINALLTIGQPYEEDE